MEVLFIARLLGYSAVEVPAYWSDVAGTKVSMRRGAAAFLDLLKVGWQFGIIGAMGEPRWRYRKDWLRRVPSVWSKV